MKFLDEVKKKAQENMETMVNYNHASYAEFKGSKVIITPSSDYSRLGLFSANGTVYAQVKPMVFDLGKEPIKAHLTGKVTHSDVVRLLDTAEAEEVKGSMYYKVPLGAFRLAGLPEELNDNLEHAYIAAEYSLVAEMFGISKPEPTIRFNEKVQETMENMGFIEKDQIIKRVNEWPKAPLKRKPTLIELESLSKQLKASELKFDLLNNEKSKLEKVDEAFDFTLRSVRGNFGECYSVNSSESGADISANPPFEVSVIKLEDMFESSLSYGSFDICH